MTHGGFAGKLVRDLDEEGWNALLAGLPRAFSAWAATRR